VVLLRAVDGAGYWVGHAFGAVIGKATEKADVARAVTATATAAFFLLCLGMAAVYLSSIWREERRKEEEFRKLIEDIQKNQPAKSPPEVRHRGRTAQEWIAVYQKRDPERWKEATEALKALGTAECVAAYVRELESGGGLDKQLDAIQALEELAARGQGATRTALPALQRIASREPRPGSEPRQSLPIKMCADAAARAIQAIQALK